MGEVSTIGLDIAKSVFQVHGVDAAGAVVIRKRISRAKVLEYFGELPPCLVGIEACPSAHHWGRELQGLGHTVRLIPPSYVKAYLKRGKNDANDAAAICEAVTRPSMRFVPIKTKEQQTALMRHRARQLLVRQRRMLSNALRGHLAELTKSHKFGSALICPVSGNRDNQALRHPSLHHPSLLIAPLDLGLSLKPKLQVAACRDARSWYALWTWSKRLHISGFLRNASTAPAWASKPRDPRSSALRLWNPSR